MPIANASRNSSAVSKTERTDTIHSATNRSIGMEEEIKVQWLCGSVESSLLPPRCKVVLGTLGLACLLAKSLPYSHPLVIRGAVQLIMEMEITINNCQRTINIIIANTLLPPLRLVNFYLHRLPITLTTCTRIRPCPIWAAIPARYGNLINWRYFPRKSPVNPQ